MGRPRRRAWAAPSVALHRRRRRPQARPAPGRRGGPAAGRRLAVRGRPAARTASACTPCCLRSPSGGTCLSLRVPPRRTLHARRSGRRAARSPGAAAPLLARAGVGPAGVPGHRRHRHGQDHAAVGPAVAGRPGRAARARRGLRRAAPRRTRTSSGWRPGRPTWRARAGSACATWCARRCGCGPTGWWSARCAARRSSTCWPRSTPATRAAAARCTPTPPPTCPPGWRRWRGRRARPGGRAQPARRRLDAVVHLVRDRPAGVGSTRCTCWSGSGPGWEATPALWFRDGSVGTGPGLASLERMGRRRRRERRAPGRGARGGRRADGRAAARSLRAARRPARRDGPWIRDVRCDGRRSAAQLRTACLALLESFAAELGAGRPAVTACSRWRPRTRSCWCTRSARCASAGMSSDALVRGQRQRGPAVLRRLARAGGRRGHRRRARRRCDTPGGGEPGVRADPSRAGRAYGRAARDHARARRAAGVRALLGTGLGADTVGWLVGTGPGRVVLTLGLLLDGVGVLWSRRLVAGVEAAL